MSMTRRDAIKFAEHAVNMTDIPEVKDFYRLASAALRPVSRERVEKVWRGYLQYHGATGTDNLAVVKCSRCGAKMYEITVDLSERKFCLCCGAPLTDEAVEITMRRLEAIFR